jgi:hypothetical protein
VLVFNPQDIFNTLYRKHCIKASKRTLRRRISDLIVPHDLTEQILKYLTSKFQLLDEKSSLEVHRATLNRQWEHWPTLKSDDTCLVCLTRVPQHRLPCGHKICEDCMLLYCDSEPNDPWQLMYEKCILCLEDANMMIRIRPPSAGESILCIDGGGVRGIIPLMMLIGVQESLDLPIPVQELFTMAYGTSVGMLPWSSEVACANRMQGP